MNIYLRKIISNSTVLLSGNTSASLINLGTVVLITKSITIAEYGVIAAIQAYVMLINKLLNFQSWQALIKYCSIMITGNDNPKFIRYLQTGIVLDAVGSLLSFCMSFLLVDVITDILGMSIDNRAYLYAYIGTLLVKFIGTPTAVLRLYDKYKYFNIMAITASLLKVTAVGSLFLTGEVTLGRILIIYIVADVFSSLFLLVAAGQILNSNGVTVSACLRVNGLIAFIKGQKRFLRFALTTNINGTLVSAVRQIDTLIIGALINVESMGIYRIIKIVSSFVGKILDPLYITIYPEFSRLVALKQDNEIRKMIIRFSSLAVLVGLCVYAVVVLYGDVIIARVFSASYLQGTSALLVYLAGLLFSFIFVYSQPLMLAYELEAHALVINGVNSAIYLSLMYLLTSVYGIVGTAVSFCVFMGVAVAARLILLQSKKKLFWGSVV